MLTEVLTIRQIEGEPRRRWFTDKTFELLVWFDESGDILAFELYYNRTWEQRALSWRKNVGYEHYQVDDGEGRPGKMKASPILVPDGWFDHEKIAQRFKEESALIEPAVSSFIHDKILDYVVHSKDS